MSYSALRKGRYSEPGREYLLTAVTWRRETVFSDFAAARLLVRELRMIEQDGLGAWFAWVVMPDHFHGLLSLGDGGNLAGAVKRLKGRTARSINAALARSGPLWQPGFHDHALRDEEDRIAVARYLVANPLRSGLVGRLADYPHWDSIWL